MVVAAQHHGSRKASVGDGPVESLRDFRAAFAVRIEDTGLRTDDEPIAARFADPVDVVVELARDFGGSRAADLLQHFGREAVGKFEVFGFSRRADPAERSEAVVEEHRSHDVLHVGGITEPAALAHHGGSGARSLQQEGVSVIEEVHAAGRQLIDRIDLTAQRLLHAFAETGRLLGHHLVRSLVAHVHRIITARPRIMQRSLIGTQIHRNLFGGEPLPKVHDIAHIGHRNRFALPAGPADAGNQLVERLVPCS